MLLDVFSSMDFYWSDLGFLKVMFIPWCMIFLIVLVIFLNYFGLSLKNVLCAIFFYKGWIAVLKRFSLFFLVVVSCFYLFLLGNVLGLFPYMFSCTSHVFFNFSFSFVLWFIIILVYISLDFLGFLAHQTPLGSPFGLSFGLKLVELISNFIRPFTLALRLSVKMSTGHVFIYLLSSGCLGFLWFGVFVLSMYIIFEIAICFVQGFVFSLLLVQYADEI